MKKQEGHGNFPDDCWELIFQKLREDDERALDSISLVSKRFLSISNRVKLSLKVRDKTLPLLLNLLRRFQNIETLLITAHKEIDGLLDLISRSGVLNLQAIEFRWCMTEPPRAGFKALALNKNIKDDLKVLDCFGLVSMQDKDLVLIADLFPRLEELRIQAGKQICSIAKARPSLKMLQLNCFEGKYFEIHGALKLLLQACQLTLKELILVRWSLTDTAISDLAQHLSNLTFIDLHACFGLTSVIFYTLTKSCPSLETLKMAYTREQVMDNFSPKRLHENYRMRHLDVFSNLLLTDMMLKNFGQVCPNLKFLSVSEFKRLTNLGIGEVLRRCPAITAYQWY
ncbi:uncharacterized protein LOC131303383 isoform X2 [Rhododendron vialii]|uniref:uncharacterized protein LOC131303383 isoform X2 n=2 Tax=Rhododendron vialii TaxID=182163 RepID=UPI0026604A05|nr:uncharacterized protein LOC131303383 isoform X2 [Rhododendron vialii]